VVCPLALHDSVRHRLALVLAIFHLVLARTLREDGRGLERVVGEERTFDGDADVPFRGRRGRCRARRTARNARGHRCRSSKIVKRYSHGVSRFTRLPWTRLPSARTGTVHELSLVADELVDRLRIHGAVLHHREDEPGNGRRSRDEPNRENRAHTTRRRDVPFLDGYFVPFVLLHRKDRTPEWAVVNVLRCDLRP